MAFESKIRPIYWDNGISKMLDQTIIPYEYKYVDIKTGQQMFDAIKTMIVRGAPAIGIAGAQGIVLYAQEGRNKYRNISEFKSWLIEKAEYMSTSRPTAVNLMWACEQQKDVKAEDRKETVDYLLDQFFKKKNENQGGGQ